LLTEEVETKGKNSMFSLLQADLFKLRKRAMGWVMLAIVALFVPLTMFANAAIQPGKTNYNFTRSILAGAGPLPSIGAFTIIILGAILTGSEYGYDTWKNFLIRRPGRVPFIISKWLTMLISLCVALVTLMVLGVIAGLVLQTVMHLTGLPVQLAPLTIIILILMQTLLPIIAGSIAILGSVMWRSSVAGIVLGIFWYILDAVLGGLEPIASVGTAVTTLQVEMTGLILGPGGTVSPGQLSASTVGPFGVIPPLLVIVYLVVPVTLAALFFKKRDMLGIS
jgi:ABC-type transport system involved in multi-copper enzyme maturation permease subunit